MCKEYNGYTNYETWNVALWLNNEYSEYQHWTERAQELKEETQEESFYHRYWTAEEYAKFTLADEIKKQIENDNPLLGEASLYSDILSANLSAVNWHGVAESFLED